MKDIKNIGVFDSGVGGLSVLRNILDLKLDSIVYYGDNARLPYGSKDSNTIVGFCLDALNFFKNFDIDLLIVACNTASAHAISHMQQHSSIPVIGVIQSGILAATQIASCDENILVVATKATIQSKAYESGLLNKGYCKVDSIGANLLVNLVEEGIYNGPILNACFDHYFGNLRKPDVIILGCTHFPLLRDSFLKYFGH